MNTSRHHPRKRFGQHFLSDMSVLQHITQAIHPRKTDHMVEIGPGQGVLTELLLPSVKRLDVIEIDHDLVRHLETLFSNEKNFHLHPGDVLAFDFSTLTPIDDQLRIVGNLPYNISTPLLFKLFTVGPLIKDMHFMLQKEVVERLCAKVGGHHYGRLSVMAQYFCENLYLFTVGPEAFSPPPKINSAVIRMLPHKEPPHPANNLETFSLIVKEAFCYRRKTLANCLKKYITSHELEHLDINPTRRPQELTVEEFIKISNSINQ